jgi:hypothetical protein
VAGSFVFDGRRIFQRISHFQRLLKTIIAVKATRVNWRKSEWLLSGVVTALATFLSLPQQRFSTTAPSRAPIRGYSNLEDALEHPSPPPEFTHSETNHQKLPDAS